MTVSTDPRKTGISAIVDCGSGTFAQMKALTGMTAGAQFLVTNYGRGGSLWRYSSTLSDWFPVAPTKVYENTSTIDGILQAADQLLLAIPLEANLIANKVFRLLVTAGKDGTTDAGGTFSIRMGTAGTTADTSVGTASLLVAGNRSAGMEVWHRMASATSVERLGAGLSTPFDGSSSLLLNAATTVANVTTQATFLTLTTTMGGTTNKPQLGYVALEIQP
jgi:hypothetical protein